MICKNCGEGVIWQEGYGFYASKRPHWECLGNVGVLHVGMLNIYERDETVAGLRELEEQLR